MTSFTTQISNGIARLEFNLPGEPVNKISHAVRLELESLLDSLAADTREVREAYRYALRCEIDFFTAALEGGP